MNQTLNQIAAEIDAYIRRYNEPYARWYVGIACAPRDRLFIDHNVSEQHDRWIYRNAGTDTAARAIEKMFHDTGCKGGPCGGDCTTCSVYAYFITSTTRE
jgi:hypothetical protein